MGDVAGQIEIGMVPIIWVPDSEIPSVPEKDRIYNNLSIKIK